MAHLFRPIIICYTKDGRRVPKETPGAKKVKTKARKWYAKGSPLPKGKKVPLASDKRTALQLLAELEVRYERGATELGSSEVLAARKPLTEHLSDFAQHLRNKGAKEEHVTMKEGRIRRLIVACGFVYPPDIDSGKVQKFLAEMIRDGRPIPPLDPARETYKKGELADALGLKSPALASLIRRHRLPGIGNGKARRFPRETAEALYERLVRPRGTQTANYYLAAVRSFCRWMVKTKPRRLSENPLDDLRASNAKIDVRRDRRPLPIADLVKLFDITRQSDRVFRGLDGRARFMLYLTACGTGFRAGELAILTPKLFALDATPPVVALPAREDKAGRSVTQPLPPALVEPLREYLDGRPIREPIWPGSWANRCAEMLQADLVEADIPYVIEGPDGPLYADFHSLRHSFVALLEHAGLSLKQAMTLARHSDPKLTMVRYGKAQLADLGAAVGRLPELAAPRGADPKPLDALPPDLLRALAVLGLAGLAAGWFGNRQ